MNTTTVRMASVDLCVPVYNSSGFVAETLDSILTQEFKDFRLLISVDRSSDQSADICRGFKLDKRVEVFEQKQQLGFVGNSNFLMRSARAPFMKFLPHDDVMPPQLLGLLYNFMVCEPECTIAIPELVGFGPGAENLGQHEVRGTAYRRMLDIIMNQRSVAAFHGLVRIDPRPAFRPMLPTDYLRDYEADVDWMATAAIQGELRRVEGAVEQKRFGANTKSANWRPRTLREGRELLVQRTARLSEMAFTLCTSELQEHRVLLAALVRLYGTGLNWGGEKAGRRMPFFKSAIWRMLRKSLRGKAGERARRTSLFSLEQDMHQDKGEIGASLMARRAELQFLAGHDGEARNLFQNALAMDPKAGWAEPFRLMLEPDQHKTMPSDAP